MVIGLFLLYCSVSNHPKSMNDILLFYLDSVEWVNAPITVGMPQYAEGSLLASKLYVAPGNYIKHMSNYCDPCRFHPDKAICEDACPFTTLYLDFLQRIEMRFARHPRTAVQWRNLSLFGQNDKRAIWKTGSPNQKNGWYLGVYFLALKKKPRDCSRGFLRH